MTLGVGIISHQRRASVLRIVAAVRELTAAPTTLVVADDGSSDGTADACRAVGVRVVEGERRGPAWNRNRALWHLLAAGCETIVLLEDDLIPVVVGWDGDWTAAVERWGVVSYALPTAATEGGDGTPEDPVRSAADPAGALGLSRTALEVVGFFDSRFRGYGPAHGEWSLRTWRVGLGVARHPQAVPEQTRTLGIAGGLEPLPDDGRHGGDDELAGNRRLLRRIAGATVYRDPWSGDEQRRAFLAEQRLNGVPDGGRTLRVRPVAVAEETETTPGSATERDAAERPALRRSELVLLSLQPGVADPLEEHMLRRTAPRTIATAPELLARIPGGVVDGHDLLALGPDLDTLLVDSPPAAPIELRDLGLRAAARGELTRPAGPVSDAGPVAVLAGVTGRSAAGSFWLGLVPRLLLARDHDVLADGPVLTAPLRLDERDALRLLGLDEIDLQIPPPDALHRYGELIVPGPGAAAARRVCPAALARTRQALEPATADAVLPRRLFVARRDALARRTDFSALHDLLHRHGFEAMWDDEHTAPERMFRLARAEALLMVEGPWLDAVLLAPEGALVVELIGEGATAHQIERGWTLTSALHQRHAQIVCRRSGPGAAAITLDLDHLDRALLTLLAQT
jgi:hypothetical protein